MQNESLGHPQSRAPEYKDLPAPRLRAARGGPVLREVGVRLEVVTPILGGSYQTRAIDQVDVIRAPSVRGHLRFWWRALYASQIDDAAELYRRESALWGCAANDAGGRSAVEIRVRVERRGGTDNSDIRLYPGKGQEATPGAYALWPARAETTTNTPTAPRRQPGTQFQVTLRIAGSEEKEAEVRNALRAWILFGGYGGRTRRGLGSLRVMDDAKGWLPSTATRDALAELFGHDVFAAPARTPCDVPWLGGAAMRTGRPGRNAQDAWKEALDWLKQFRQGSDGHAGRRAREPGTDKVQPTRPSISNWPEADKIRHIKNKTQAHKPRHNATPAWPRAGFGLPIFGQFQKTDRSGNKQAYDEPAAFELRWRAGDCRHDRLASPLIVKALPLADGSFVPCALWLNRAYPANGAVFLRNSGDSEAPFDRLPQWQSSCRLDGEGCGAPGDAKHR